MENSYILAISKTPLQKLKEEQAELLKQKAEYDEICRKIDENQKEIEKIEKALEPLPFPRLVSLTRHANPPTEGNECLEAVWSKGSSCRECTLDCYRKGWSKSEVDKDNRRRVQVKNNGSRKIR